MPLSPRKRQTPLSPLMVTWATGDPSKVGLCRARPRGSGAFERLDSGQKWIKMDKTPKIWHFSWELLGKPWDLGCKKSQLGYAEQSWVAFSHWQIYLFFFRTSTGKYVDFLGVGEGHPGIPLAINPRDSSEWSEMADGVWNQQPVEHCPRLLEQALHYWYLWLVQVCPSLEWLIHFDSYCRSTPHIFTVSLWWVEIPSHKL